MSIVARYNALIQQGDLRQDKCQLQALTALEYLATTLNKQHQLLRRGSNLVKNDSMRSSLLKAVKYQLLHWLSAKPSEKLNGIYLYGKVGRGKTMMMDLFYQHLHTPNKQRMHFHHFLELMHQQLTQLTGNTNPLNVIATEFASKVDVLCFDEFFVSDIGDAMLLSGLFKELFAQGITLVATSNCAPNELYQNGLQRQRFVPTIKLIELHCDIINVNGYTDHRQHNQHYQRYVFPLSKGADFLQQSFIKRSTQPLIPGTIEVNNRLITYMAIDDSRNVVMFDFNSLCKGARSQRDYMFIAKKFNTVLLMNVPAFTGKPINKVVTGIEDGFKREQDIFVGMQSMDDEARRFIALVDEFYDQGVELIVAAEVDIKRLYQARKLAFEFARCESRLMEMQMIEYSP